MKTLFTLLVLLVSSNVLAGPAATKIECGGSEPSWGLSIVGNTLTYKLDKDPTLKLKVLATRHARGTQDYYSATIKTKYSSLTLVQGECIGEDGETVHSHHGVYEIKGEMIAGCCDVTLPVDKAKYPDVDVLPLPRK